MKIKIYLENGVNVDYNVENEEIAQKHISAILRNGFVRKLDNEDLEHYPPYRILKVVKIFEKKKTKNEKDDKSKVDKNSIDNVNKKD